METTVKTINTLRAGGASRMAKTAEATRRAMRTLVELEHPTQKIRVTYEATLSFFPSVACYTGQSPEEGPCEANTHRWIVYKPIAERPF